MQTELLYKLTLRLHLQNKAIQFQGRSVASISSKIRVFSCCARGAGPRFGRRERRGFAVHVRSDPDRCAAALHRQREDASEAVEKVERGTPLRSLLVPNRATRLCHRLVLVCVQSLSPFSMSPKIQRLEPANLSRLSSIP